MQYDSEGTLRHLYAIEELQQHTVEELFSLADEMQTSRHLKSLTGHTLCNAFFEASTRTVCSFELAAKKLGIDVINFISSTSSEKKGETLTDTLQTLSAMGFDAITIRHSFEGTAKKMAECLDGRTTIINAGDGCNEHPTQALLDAYTIRQHKPDFATLSIAIVGDIIHSRVARSLILILKLLGAQDIRLIGPKNLLPTPEQYPNVILDTSIDAGLQGVDVAVMLRIQHERMEQSVSSEFKDNFQPFELTPSRTKLLKKDAIIMHPGPINRNIEIASSVADSNQSVILEQVRNGVLLRMAVLHKLLAK